MAKPGYEELLELAVSLARLETSVESAAEAGRGHAEGRGPVDGLIGRARDIVGRLTPADAKPVSAWVAGPEDAEDNRHFTHGPALQLWEIMGLGLPEGHAVFGMSAGGDVLVRGLVKGGDIDWTYFVQRDRRSVADALYEEAELGRVEAADGWRWSGEEASRGVYLESDGDAPTTRRILSIRFAEGSAEVLEATFDGDDVMMRRNDPADAAPGF